MGGKIKREENDKRHSERVCREVLYDGITPTASGGGATPEAATGLSDSEGSGWSGQRNGGSASRLPVKAAGDARIKLPACTSTVSYFHINRVTSGFLGSVMSNRNSEHICLN